MLVVLFGKRLKKRMSSKQAKQKSRLFRISSMKCSKVWAAFLKPKDIKGN